MVCALFEGGTHRATFTRLPLNSDLPWVRCAFCSSFATYIRGGSEGGQTGVRGGSERVRGEVSVKCRRP
eukprot:893199-Prorocentrum_minimum.AAC.1